MLVVSQRVHYAVVLTDATPTGVSDVLRQAASVSKTRARVFSAMRGLSRLIFGGPPAVAIAYLTDLTGGGRLLIVVVLQLALGEVFGFSCTIEVCSFSESYFNFSQAGFFRGEVWESLCQTSGRSCYNFF